MGEAEFGRLGGERRRRRLVAGDDRVAAEDLPGVARQAAVDAVGKEGDRGERVVLRAGAFLSAGETVRPKAAPVPKG